MKNLYDEDGTIQPRKLMVHGVMTVVIKQMHAKVKTKLFNIKVNFKKLKEVLLNTPGK